LFFETLFPLEVICYTVPKITSHEVKLQEQLLYIALVNCIKIFKLPTIETMFLGLY